MKSMTGFGRGQSDEKGYLITCEIKGVNHRYFDPFIRMPRRYGLLEERIKEAMKQYVTRGRLEVSINIEKTGESQRNIKVDKELAIAYYNYLKELADNLSLSAEIKVIDLFRLPEVSSLQEREEDLEEVWELIKSALDIAMENLLAMRIKEGQNLARDIAMRSQTVLGMVESLETRSPQVTKEYGDKLRKRISEWIPAEEMDEQRLLQEILIFADRSNVTEEIVRLKSHIEHLNELMQSEDAVGRKADFLVQEMFREINTIGSKANDLEMNRLVVETKAEIEKIREQLQNIE
ncbi:YicC/YloC family endoribonuclease [Syntrophomonas palmitatica]|uniref:YicC/YloC family endoribonuclease n=1 Tax=Syntrophomonas palmitatica TaxID=402877 RepID=UPI0006D0DE23|nr:YicC/YloC family endoribonuclease [Syntrophomonas palmitatica]